MTSRALRKAKQNSKAQQGDNSEELKRLRESQTHFPYRAGDSRHPHCTPQDHPSKKNCYCNPHCLYGLGEKKEGIWGPRCQLLASVGADPSMQIRGYKQESAKENKAKKGADAKKRKVKKAAPEPTVDIDALLSDNSILTKVPAGLENLGATCYLNSLLQCLFYNRSFREGVYHFRAPQQETQEVASMARILKELQHVFAHLQLGRRAEYNPRKFADLLGLDSSEQQDPQEFNRLFMDKIEECFKVLGDGKLNSLINDMFRGQQRYVTTCCSCHTQSTRLEAFCELEVNIDKDTDKTKTPAGEGAATTGGTKSKSTPSVTDCIASYLMAEDLTGDNQYFCSQCAKKQDAKRAIELAKLPPVLCIQLIRYRFDRETMQRKKLKNSVYLEESLDLGSFFCSADTTTGPGRDMTYQYDLVAVLYHKGSQATGGHYVAEVKDTETDRWWLFDDETVKPSRGDHSGEEAVEKDKEKDNKDKGAATGGAHAANAGVVDLSGEQDVAVVSAEENNDGESEKDDEDHKAMNGTSGKRKRAAAGEKSKKGGSTSTPKGSSDAYMLIYKARGFVDPPSAALQPPDDVEESVKEENDGLRKAVEDYKEKKRKLEESIRLRKETYEQLFHTDIPPGAREGEPYVWIETKYLKQWIIGEKIKVENTNNKGGGAAGDKSKSGKKAGVVMDITGDEDDQLKAALEASLEDAKPPASVPPDNGVLEVVDDDDEPSPSAPTAKAPAGEEESSPPAAQASEVFADQLDMTKYQCPHGKLDPNKTQYLKVVRKEVFDRIMAESKEPPTVEFSGKSLQAPPNTVDYHCNICVEEFQHAQSRKLDDRESHDAVIAALSASEPAEADDSDEHPVYLLARKWETAFRRYHGRANKTLIAPPTQNAGAEFLKSPPKAEDAANAAAADQGIDPFVNTGLTCEHNRLKANLGKQAKRLDAVVWAKIKAVFPQAIEYRIDAEPCQTCREQTAHDADWKKQKQKERDNMSSNLKNLTSRRSPYPHNFTKALKDSKEPLVYYLVEHDWVQEWKGHYKEFDSDIPRPPDNTPLLCTEHSNLLLHPEIERLVKGELADGECGSSMEEWLSKQLKRMEVVDQRTWEDIKALYEDEDLDGCPLITLTLMKSNEARSEQGEKKDGRGDKKSVDEVDDDDDDDDDDMEWDFVFQPPQCDECIRKKTQEREEKVKVFKDQPLKMIFLRKNEDAPTTGEQSGGRRRQTRSARKDSRMIKAVSSDDKVGLLKLKAIEAAEIQVDHQSLMVYFDGKLLAEFDLTVEGCGIRADSTLHVKIVKKEEDETYDERIWEYACKNGEPISTSYRPEQGFKGTILSQGPWKSSTSSSDTRQMVVAVDDEEEEDIVVDDAHASPGPNGGTRATPYEVDLEVPPIEVELDSPIGSPRSPPTKKVRVSEEEYQRAVTSSFGFPQTPEEKRSVLSGDRRLSTLSQYTNDRPSMANMEDGSSSPSSTSSC